MNLSGSVRSSQDVLLLNVLVCNQWVRKPLRYSDDPGRLVKSGF